MITHMAHFNCISFHPSFYADNAPQPPLCVYLFSLRPPSLHSNPWVDGKTRRPKQKYRLDFFHHPPLCLAPYHLFANFPIITFLLMHFLFVYLFLCLRSFSLKTRVFCQDIAVFGNITAHSCQKPAEIHGVYYLPHIICVTANISLKTARSNIIIGI